MYCKWCNGQTEENSKFCSNCGRELNGVNNNQEQSFTNVNQNFNTMATNVSVEKVNVWLAILSYFIPLVGLIIFLVKKGDKPKTAKVCGICALVSFILNLIVVVLAFVLMFSATDRLFDDLSELGDSSYQDEYNDDYFNDAVDNGEVSNGEVSSGSATNDWKKYEVVINNNTVTLPTSYDNLSNLTNSTLKSSDLKSYIQGGYYGTLNMYKNDKLSLYIEVLNDTDSDLLYTDCKVTRISQTKYQVSQGADVVVFPGGLKAGESITEDKIIELFGTPSDTYEYSSDGYEKKTYKYFEDDLFTTTNNYIITVVNGLIDELQLDNRR